MFCLKSPAVHRMPESLNVIVWMCVCVSWHWCVCVYILGAFKDLSPSGKCVLSYWDQLGILPLLSKTLSFYKIFSTRTVCVLEPEPILGQFLVRQNWSLSQIGCMFPQTGQTNSDLMLQHVVYLTITSVKTNIACPGVGADSMAFLFCRVILVYWHLS